jgi:hypothetical protein
MKRAIAVLIAGVVLVGAAWTVSAQTTTVITPAPPTLVTTQPVPGKYSGEAWTWDSARSIVTLYDSGVQYRVQTTPDQIARLTHHGWATVTGTLLPPEPIETVLLPAQPMAAIANGPATTAEVTGHITAIDPNGVAMIETPRGPMRVWVADNPQTRFSQGRPVAVHVSVQPVRMVAVAGTGGQASGPTLAAPPPVRGDQAVVVGRILSVNPAGTLTVDSPRGPIAVWVPSPASFKIGDYVQIQTVVQPA